MAKLIPPIPKNCPNSERLLFERLGRELPDEWTVLHSLELTNHPHKMWGETDLVVISTKGVFVIEVKGGSLACKDGMWRVSTLNGREVYSKQESPWGQAGTAAAAIRKQLYDDERFRGCLVGYGVALPFESFTTTGAEIIQEVLWDRRHRRENLAFFVGRLASYWKDRHSSTRSSEPRQLTKADVAEIRQLLRPDIDSHFSLGSYLNSLEAELLELTAAQAKILKGMAGNSKTIVSGMAGTGKTILAVDKAKYCAAKEGKSVLLLCFNRLLATHIAKNIPEELAEKVQVASVHSFYRDVIGKADRLNLLNVGDRNDEEFYGTVMPEAFIESALTIELEPYDVLIVDEAQDLLTPSHLDAMDLLVKNGLSFGNWHLFLDPKQDIYGKLSEQAQDRLLQIGYASYELTANCRNTRPVATETSVVAGFECAVEGAIDGPECKLLTYSSPGDFQGKIVGEIGRLLNQEVAPQDIVILSSRAKENSLIKDLRDISEYPIVDLSSREPPLEHVGFCTMHSFKGLERKCVIAIDLHDLDDEASALLHYTGLSRAQSLLITFLSTENKALYDRHLRDFGARLVAH